MWEQVFYEAESSYVVWAGLECMTVLLGPPEGRDYQYVLPMPGKGCVVSWEGMMSK